MRNIIVTLALLWLPLAAQAVTVQAGINGHPLTQEGYRDVPLDTQIGLVARMGVHWYRCDLPADAATPAGIEHLDRLITAATMRRINVLPVLFPPVDLAKDSEAAIRTKAREYARTLATHFRSRIHIWELHNELDAFAMIHKGERDRTGAVWQWGDADGDRQEHYEEGRYARARAVLCGLAEGIHAADPTAQRMINSAGWLHIGFVKRLIADAVPFEILGWHWYSEMGSITSAKGINVIARISELGKPIWLSELNRRGGDMGPDGATEMATTVSRMASEYVHLARRYPIRGILAYELLDEPYFGPDNPESHYGFVTLKRGADGRWTPGSPKPAFDALRHALAPTRTSEPGRTRTFAELPPATRAKIGIRLRKRSSEIQSSPFATLTSFEVHGADEDAAVIDAMANLGVKWVVMHNIHGSLPDPADKRLNAWLEGCRKAGIGVRCILTSRDRDLWVRAVRNYGDRIRTFSFLNEPNAPTNNDHTKPAVPPNVYARELASIAKAVKAVRPDIRIFGPETAMLQCMEDQPYPWLQLALDAGLAKTADGISIHPYRQSYGPSNTPEKPSTFEGRPTPRYKTYEQQIATLREMTGGKPIAVTEVGWSTAPMGPLNGSTHEAISELTQAKFAIRQQVQDFALGIECAVFFMLRERHVNAPYPAGHIENEFGILRVDNTPKPAYTALQTLYSQLDAHSHSNTRVPVRFGQPGVKWYVFDDSSSAIPIRRVIYWLPVAASDDFQGTQTNAVIDGVTVRGIWLSDAPRILRLHRVASVWGYPIVIDLIGQSVDMDVDWAPGRVKRP